METKVLIALFLVSETIAEHINILHGSGRTEQVLPSYLDLNLWYNTTTEQLSYNVKQHKFIHKKVDVIKFKYDDTSETHQKYLTRRRRNVFGKDNRFHIRQRFVGEFPFQSVVRLGNGCTGTLIWYRHVLTSAHCVHDRTNYKPAVKELRIGLLRTDGTFKWFGAKRVTVPNAWKKKKGMVYLNHDYAVIELDRPHGRRWMAFGAYEVSENQYIQFAGFPSDKASNEMWYSYCSISRLHKHVFLNYCDATPGMSGSGVYVYNKHDRYRKIVAVFSSYVQYKKYGGERTVDFNVATRLTSKKIRRLCKWMEAGPNCYRIKSDYENQLTYF